MKNQLTTLLCCLIIVSSKATNIDTLKVASSIKHVTVFFSGAEVSRTIPFNKSKGKYVLVLEGLPQEINPQSIQVSGMNHVSILAVKHDFHVPEEDKKDERVKDLNRIIKKIKEDLTSLSDDTEVLDIEERLLNDNSQFQQSNSKASVTEIKEAADFYRLRLNDIRKQQRVIQEDMRQSLEDLKKQTALLNELRAYNRKSYSKITIAISCAKQVSDELKVSYFIGSAGWEPLYDFRVKDITEPLEIVYQANVFQASGEDWKQVDLTLTTGKPELSGVKPELKKWILGQKPSYRSQEIQEGIGTLNGIVFDESSHEPMAFVNVVLKKDGEAVGGGVTDFDGRYSIKPINTGEYSIQISSVGYHNKEINHIYVQKDKKTTIDVAMTGGVQLAAFQIVQYKVPLIEKDAASSNQTFTRQDIAALPTRSSAGVASTVGGVTTFRNENLNVRGARSDKTYYYVDGVKVSGRTTENLIGNSMKTGVTNLSYNIDIPYTIPSDGEQYSIKIKATKLDVNYVYHLVPKLEPDAFLSAEISDWEALNLLSGKLSVYYQGTFTGESYVDTEFTDDTLSVSLGRDKSVIGLRHFKKDMNDKRLTGNYFKEQIGVEIEIKNNKQTAVQIIVEDQIPLSDRKTMEVEILETSEAKHDDKTGILTWKLLVPAETKKTLLMRYEVKYPKYAKLGLE